MNKKLLAYSLTGIVGLGVLGGAAAASASALDLRSGDGTTIPAGEAITGSFGKSVTDTNGVVLKVTGDAVTVASPAVSVGDIVSALTPVGSGTQSTSTPMQAAVSAESTVPASSPVAAPPALSPVSVPSPVTAPTPVSVPSPVTAPSPVSAPTPVSAPSPVSVPSPVTAPSPASVASAPSA